MKPTTKTRHDETYGLRYFSFMPNVPQVLIGNAYRLEEVDFETGLVKLYDESLSALQDKGISLYVGLEEFKKHFLGVERVK